MDRGLALQRVATALAGRLVDGEHIVAVQVNSGHSVACASARHAGVGRRVCKWHFGRVLVVFADEKHRQLPDCRHVQPFVERAVIHGSVTEERDGHTFALQQHEAISGAGRLKDAWANDAAGAHHADVGGEEMHAAAAPLRAAGGAAEQLREQPPGCEPLRKSVTVTTVRTEDDVFLLEICTNTGCYGFLSDVSVTRTVNKPRR